MGTERGLADPETVVGSRLRWVARKLRGLGTGLEIELSG